MTNRAQNPLLYLLCAGVAFSSLVYELVLAQTLAATLGGTTLRYATSIGLFTFTLGLGAMSFSRVPRHWNLGRVFSVCQIVLCLVGLFAPWLIATLDPASHSSTPRWLLETASYSPLLLVGWLSGFELPVLMAMTSDKKTELRVLAVDYLGMFVGCLAFPLILLPELGVFATSYAAASINLVCAALGWVFFARSPAVPLQDSTPSQRPLGDHRKWHFVFPEKEVQGLLVLAFVLAFCSMCYELLIAKALTEIAHDEVVSQSLTIGMYLLGLGLGSWHESRRETRDAMKSLLKVEVALTCIGALSVVAIYAAAAFFEVALLQRIEAVARDVSWFSTTGVLVLMLMPLALVVGYISGFEIPLLLKNSRLAKRMDSAATVLGASYFGSLAAGFAVPLLLIPKLGSFRAVVVIALLNFAVCIVLASVAIAKSSRLIIRRLPWLILPSLALPLAVSSIKPVEQAFLKIVYLELSVSQIDFLSFGELKKALSSFGDIPRLSTSYQNIDIVDETVSNIPEIVSDFTLYLNRQPQFSRSTTTTYHESFVHGAINLAIRMPRRVLILGGGDGLLASELLRYPEIESLHMVELDPVMVEFSRQHPEIARMNRGALDDPRLKIEIGDGFTFVRAPGEKFDAIFIDFPYPSSFDLLKLFSVEFYTAVRERLSPDGFAVLDAPMWRYIDQPDRPSPQPHEIMLNTVWAAGFGTSFPYGPLEPFMYLESTKREPRFDYSALPDFVGNRAFVNLKGIRDGLGVVERNPDWVNSIFHPRRFK